MFWLTGFWLGYTGFSQYTGQVGESYSWLDKLYLTIQLVIFESGGVAHPPLALNIARFLLPFLTAQTSLMALAGFFSREYRQFALRFSRGHIIVCGDGELGFYAAQALLKGQKKVVWVTQSEREKDTQTIDELGGVVIEGNISNVELAGKIALHKASTFFSFYGGDHENIENALLAERILADRHKDTLQCITHVHDPLLSNLFLEQMLKADWKKTIQHDVINIYELGARLVLQKYPLVEPAHPQNDISILIIGFGKFGQHLLAEMVSQLVRKTPRLHLDAHILDREACWKRTSLYKRYPQLEQFCYITPHEIDIFSPEFQDTEKFLHENCPNVQTVYICLSDDAAAVNTALTIYRQLKEKSPQIILRLMHSGAVRDLFEYGEAIECIRGVAFYDEISTPQVLLNSSVELVARANHEHYLEQRAAEGVGGPSVVEWAELSEEKKESNRQLARYLKRHLQTLGYQLAPRQDLFPTIFTFSPQEVDALARSEHERWCEEMRAKGYRYGLNNDPKQKTNPYLRPWEDLSDAEKKFNREFIRILPQLVANAGLQISVHKRAD